MNILNRHSWDVDLATAKQIQLSLKHQITLQPLPKLPETIAGADVTYSQSDKMYFASALVFDLKTMRVIEQAAHCGEVQFPYISGYLTFREGPILLRVFEKLKNVPDVIIFDGQGIAHHRKMGIAAHLGLFLELPTIGCAKRRLVGIYEEPSPEFGSWSELRYHDELIGAVVRTRQNCKPVFVSPGHLIDIPDAIQTVLQCCAGYRIPEPVRQAHITVNKIRKEYET
jgi:deoxyribonuclease V